MPASSLLALIDDIATILDDVAVLTKIAAKKTAGVLGDDLALNAQQVAGVQTNRELPVVWAVAKGSAVNKAILVPSALLISAVAPWLVTPLLMIGGAFLCYEGVEKLAHKFLHSPEEENAHKAELVAALADSTRDMVAFEKEKIKGAVRTDFILSAEIVVIALGTVAESPFWTRVGVLVGVAVLMTVGVYGLVAGIVKLDDAGLAMTRKQGTDSVSRLIRGAGAGLLKLAPVLMKFLSVAGTAAMFLVGGSILLHGVPALHHSVQDFAGRFGGFIGGLVGMAGDAIAGVLAGAVVLAVVEVLRRLFRAGKSSPAH